MFTSKLFQIEVARRKQKQYCTFAAAGANERGCTTVELYCTQQQSSISWHLFVFFDRGFVMIHATQNRGKGRTQF